MCYIGKSKISEIHPKPNTSYPLLCLPQAFNDFVGKTTHIYETEQDGKQAFLVVLDKNNGQGGQSDAQVMQPVMQPKAEVKQQYLQNNIENRVSKLEIELSAMKKFIL